MDQLKKFFPLSFKFRGDSNEFVKGIIILALGWLFSPAIITVVTTVLVSVLSMTVILLPVGIIVGAVLEFAAGLVSLYFLASLVIHILVYTNVIKVDVAAQEEEIEEEEKSEEEVVEAKEDKATIEDNTENADEFANELMADFFDETEEKAEEK